MWDCALAVRTRGGSLPIAGPCFGYASCGLATLDLLSTHGFRSSNALDSERRDKFCRVGDKSTKFEIFHQT